jgi:cytochrome c oxidase subunit IV
MFIRTLIFLHMILGSVSLKTLQIMNMREFLSHVYAIFINPKVALVF